MEPAILFAGLIMLGATASVAAAPPRDPEATVVDELVVTAKAAGPAWWRVNTGASTVWVLAVPAGLPKGFRWDMRGLEMRLTGAREVITPATGSASLFDLPAFLRLRGRMKNKAPLEATLPPDLRARFLAASAALRQDPRRYDHWNGLWAAFLMIVDFDKGGAMDYRAPLPAIEHAAGVHGLRPKAAATYRAMPIFREGAAELTPEVAQACLGEALAVIESGRGRQQQAAAGWARGDVRAALTAPGGFQHCLNMLPEGARLSRQSMADEAAAIGAALGRPGVAVAVVPLRQWLAEDGVLERLKARGYRVEAAGR